MRFSVLFWNILLDNQTRGRANAGALLHELTRMLQKYQPDCVGLHEVLQHKDSSAPFVLDAAAELGYTSSHFAASSPIDKYWTVGTAVLSPHPLESVADIVLGHDVYAESEGFPGHTLKAVATRIRLPQGPRLSFVAAHPVHLRRRFLQAHYQHTQALTQFLREFRTNSEPVVIGGDFNEPRVMPGSFRQANKDWLHHQTGTFGKATWRLMGAPFIPIRANLDKLFWAKQSALRLIDFKVLPTRASDHRPIFAVFEYSE